MALSPRLKTRGNINEEELIRKGGSSGQEARIPCESSDKEVKRVNLRIPSKYLERIDRLLTNRLGNVSRNTWMIEAIVEKLGKEENRSEVSLTSQEP